MISQFLTSSSLGFNKQSKIENYNRMCGLWIKRQLDYSASHAILVQVLFTGGTSINEGVREEDTY